MSITSIKDSRVRYALLGTGLLLTKLPESARLPLVASVAGVTAGFMLAKSRLVG